MNDKPNPLKDKSFQFALKIIKLYTFLSEKKKEYVMSKQLLRSGTSIGDASEILKMLRSSILTTKQNIHHS